MNYQYLHGLDQYKRSKQGTRTSRGGGIEGSMQQMAILEAQQAATIEAANLPSSGLTQSQLKSTPFLKYALWGTGLVLGLLVVKKYVLKKAMSLE